VLPFFKGKQLRINTNPFTVNRFYTLKISTKNTPFRNLVEGRQKMSFTSIVSSIRKFGFLLILLLTIVSFSQKRPLVNAEIDTTNIRIGEQFNLKISVNEIKNVIIPKLELKGLEVVDTAKTDTLKSSLVKKYTITGFDSQIHYWLTLRQLQ